MKRMKHSFTLIEMLVVMSIAALLIALLEPTKMLRDAENAWDFSSRMAYQEAIKTLPWGSVWDYYCESQNIASDASVMECIKSYEKDVLSKRK